MARSLVAAWTRALVIGEFIGFVPPAVTGASLAALGAPDVAMVLGLTLAGSLEGFAIGETQARVLVAYGTGVDGRAWRGATAAAAGFAWFIGMAGGAALGATNGAPWLVIALVPAWTAALVAMGYVQWRVLERRIPRSRRWVAVSAVAWLVGVAIPVVALSTAPNDWPLWSHVVVGITAAVLMGATVGAITARTLDRLVAAR